MFINNKNAKIYTAQQQKKLSFRKDFQPIVSPYAMQTSITSDALLP